MIIGTYTCVTEWNKHLDSPERSCFFKEVEEIPCSQRRIMVLWSDNSVNTFSTSFTKISRVTKRMFRCQPWSASRNPKKWKNEGSLQHRSNGCSVGRAQLFLINEWTDECMVNKRASSSAATQLCRQLTLPSLTVMYVKWMNCTKRRLDDGSVALNNFWKHN